MFTPRWWGGKDTPLRPHKNLLWKWIQSLVYTAGGEKGYTLIHLSQAGIRVSPVPLVSD